MPGLVLTDLRDGVAIISYNRPEKHNAISDKMTEQYQAAWRWACDEPDARCIVLRGEGRSFSSGRDTTQLGQRPTGVGDYAFVRSHQQTNLEMMSCPKPIIAAIKGYALGGAFERCLASDIRIGSPSALMGLPEIKYGILPDTGGTQFLTSLVGPGRAKELVLTGRLIDSQQALEWGILNRIVAEDDLDTVVLELATGIASRSPLAVSIAKQLVDQCWAGEIRRGIQGELLAQTLLFTSRDYGEARASLREARRPHFEGR